MLTSVADSLGQTLFGIDPMMALGISTMGAGALGWLIGPFAGNAIFNLMHRKVKNDILVVCCNLQERRASEPEICTDRFCRRRRISSTAFDDTEQTSPQAAICKTILSLTTTARRLTA